MTDEAGKKGTEYVILERRGSDYRIMARREAFGAHAAIRAHRKTSESGRTIVAVPVSNWTEVVVEVERPEPILRLVDIEPGAELDTVVPDILTVPEPDSRKAEDPA